MRTRALQTSLFSLLFFILSHTAFAQLSIGISVGFAPPPIPVYEQPICPGDGYLWTPGYWAYDNEDGYYWVPGTWVEAPQVGYLWTPGYWGWGGSAFLFHAGYWGPHVGFYGGINYGFGYGGHGYEGGRWDGNHFSYNTYVNHVNTTIIHNTYNTTNNNINETHVSYNGGNGGITARPTGEEESFSRERHIPPIAAQTQHVQEARGNPELRASANQGRPPIAATARPSDFRAGAVPAREAGGAYRPPPADAPHAAPTAAAHGTPPNFTHASELQPHPMTRPNTNNPATDQRYQQQQDKLAARQAQDHQKLQARQEQEHQAATQKNYNDAQKQQMEQRHTQQTQHLEEKHTAQTQHLEQRQAPHQSAPRPEGKR